MSGSLVFAGKLLQPVAVAWVKKLAGPLGISRWRVERRVRSTTDLSYPASEFRKWLKATPPSDWERPVEQGATELAMRLDAGLAAVGPEWENRPGRRSAALRLVVATYGALLSISGQERRVELLAAWDVHRNEEILGRLEAESHTRGGWGLLDGPDLAVVLLQRSRARRRVRLEAVGVPEQDSGAIVEAIRVDVPVVPAGEVATLVGPYGSGKSEVAEEWHRSAIDRLGVDAEAPIPVWLSARNVRGQSLDTALNAASGSEELLRARGVALVIDGLDEVDSGDADGIAQDVRVLVGGSPRSSALLTVRPGVLVGRDDDLVARGLGDDEVLQVLRVLGVQRAAISAWPPQLKESIKRPFFALAAARALTNNIDIYSPAQLTKNLVEQALERGAGRTLLSRKEVFDSLVALAVDLTSTGHATRNFQQTSEALGTRLVMDTREGGLQFTLPIFEQWFAAQYLTQSTDLSAVLTDGHSFDRWRWSIAMVLDEAEAANVDEILASLLAFNPGAASWTIDQLEDPAQARLMAGRQSAIEADFSLASRRLARATRCWIDSVGPLGPLSFNLSETGHFEFGMQITASGALLRAWRNTHPREDAVVELPSTWDDESRREWYRTSSNGSPGHSSLWPWEVTHDDIKATIGPLLGSREALGGTSGVWMEELRYEQCRIVMSAPRHESGPFRSTEVLELCTRMLQAVPRGGRMTWQTNGSRIADFEVDGLREWLANDAPENVQRGVPGSDLDALSSNWIWGNFSDEGLLNFALEAYSRGNQAYDELAAATFPRFAWSLARTADGPLGSLCIVVRGGKGGDESEHPTVTHVELPLAILEDLAGRDDALRWANNRRALGKMGHEDALGWGGEDLRQHFDTMESWRSHNRPRGPFVTTAVSHEYLDVRARRPASKIAAEWLHDDLQRLGLASGSNPSFE